MATSRKHHGLVELFHQRPALAPEVLRDLLGQTLPDYKELRIESADLRDLAPAEVHADLVVLLRDDKPVLAIIVEVQLGIDPQKYFVWPVYVTGIRKRFSCDACVLVVTTDERVAAWARGPISLGPGSRLQPLVLGPAVVPIVSDVATACADPELAVLSAMAHGGNGDVGIAVGYAGILAAAGLGSEREMLYSDLIFNSLGDVMRSELEKKLMLSRPYEPSEYMKNLLARVEAQGKAEGELKGKAEGELKGKAEGELKGKAEGELKGKAEGKAEAILRVLEVRSVAVAPEHAARCLACLDETILDTWLERALTAHDSAAVFDG